LLPRSQKQVDISTAKELLRLFWPDFVEVNGCILAEFHSHGSYTGWLNPRTETECYLNHTHILDEFRNKATSSRHESVSPELDEVEEFYDETHPDFFAACELGMKIARLWAIKLKAEYPKERFRVYYTEYDNPIVRFHKVRPNEPEWLSDEGLQSATDPSFRNAIIYDTDHLDTPVLQNARKRTS
jgi:hypothetical protein